LQSLVLNLVHDDGIALYLNGIELYRDNLDQSASYETPALGEIERGIGYVPEWLTIDMELIPAGTWRPGRNVLAAEVHLASRRDHDSRFALALTAALVPEPSGMVFLISVLIWASYMRCARE
jgi:hypothetical protein